MLYLSMLFLPCVGVGFPEAGGKFHDCGLAQPVDPKPVKVAGILKEGASGEGFIRISYATATRDIERALEKMHVFVKKYRG